MRRLLLALLAVALVSFVSRGDIPCSAVRTQPACYVALTPGPTSNTLEVVTIDGEPTFSSDGSLLLTTVLVEPSLDLWSFIRYSFDGRVDNVDRDLIYPPGESDDEVQERNTALMDESQLDATLAGLRFSGLDVDLEFDGAQIVEVVADAPVDDILEVDDVLVAVDGTAGTTSAELVELLAVHAPGDDVTLSVIRAGAPLDLTVTLGARPDDATRPYLGVRLQSYLDLPFSVDIDAGNIGGPSAGLMFALGIVDLLGPEDLTGGAVIAGTGTIDALGNVGPIGGIRQKIAAASSLDDPAVLFLVPSANLAEARTATVGHRITLAPVSTVEDALAALADFRAGRAPAGAVALGR